MIGKSNVFRFTATTVGRATCPDGNPEAFFWDTAVPGFGLRIYASGKRVWIVQYRDARGGTHRRSLKDARILTLDRAREAATRLLAAAVLGVDAHQEAQHTILVGELVETYLTARRPMLRQRTVLEMERHLRVQALPIHQLVANEVDRLDISRLLGQIAVDSGPIAGNRLRASLSSMITWAIRSGIVEGHNPVASVPPPGKERSRDRVLTMDELARIWGATARGGDYERIIRVLILTGARRLEVGGLAWEHIDGDVWVQPRTHTKNGTEQEVPLHPMAIATLPEPRPGNPRVFGYSGNGFTAWSAAKVRLDARMTRIGGALPEWRMHDLRRTMATWMSEQGIEPHVVDALLNHVAGADRAGVRGIYNRAKYREPKRRALWLWAEHLAELVGYSP